MSLDDDLNSMAKIPEVEFDLAADALVMKWVAAGIGSEAVLEPVLRFYERHPEIDYGVPGTLCHFIEQDRGPAYNQRVIESVTRSPTQMTVLLLNRLINGTPTRAERAPLISCLRLARPKILGDPALSKFVDGLLVRIAAKHPGE